MINRTGNVLRLTVFDPKENRNKNYVKDFTNNTKELDAVTKGFEELQRVTTAEEYQTKIDELVTLMSQSINDRLVDLGTDIFKIDPVTGSLYISIDGDIIDIPLDDQLFSKKLLEKIKYYISKNVNLLPFQKFILRALNNPNIKPDDKSTFVLLSDILDYCSSMTIDETIYEDLKSQNYSEESALELATVTEVPISTEGYIHVSKVVNLDESRTYYEYVKEDGVIRKKLKSNVSVDPVTGNISTPTENYWFKPAIYMSGDKFGCGSEKEAYNYKVGELAYHDDWSKVSVLKNRPGKGLWFGIRRWTKSYENSFNYTIEALVSPENIGSICNFNTGHDVGAIIVKEAYVFNLKERGKENPAPLTLNNYGSSTDWVAMKANIKTKFGIQKVN